MMRFEYDQKFIKLLAKEMVKEMQKVKDEAKEPELITVKEAAETLNLSEDYVRKINYPMSSKETASRAVCYLSKKD